MEKIIIRENYLKRIRPFYDSSYIKVITGIRRSGKSELLKQIINEIKTNPSVKSSQIIYIDLESKIGEKITTRLKLEQEIETYIKDTDKYYIFIDEIQHIKNFEEAIASIRVSYNCSLFVTGSNSKLLQGKLKDRLTGRAKEFEIRPFTYGEMIQYKMANGISAESDNIDEYLEFGGMPQRFEEPDEDGIRKYLEDLYSSIIAKDVFGAHRRISKKNFDNISKYIIATAGKPFSALSIAKYLKNNLPSDEQKKFSETVNNYAGYLEECYFISECRPFYLNGKEALNGVKKYYAVDLGLRAALGNVIELDNTFALENLIYNELIFRGYTVKYGKLSDGEIDFVAIRGKKKCLIQVAWSVNEEKTYLREYGAYKNVNDYSPKFVMTMDTKDTSINGIAHIYIPDFLNGKTDIFLS